MDRSENFSIRQMIELTGLSEFTIRGWESRYEAFCPKRSETGRREYSKNDVERALLLRELIKRDHKIGQIAGLKVEKLRALLEPSAAVTENKKAAVQSEVVSKAIELMALQRWAELETLIKKVGTKNVSRLIKDFLLPALRALSEGVTSEEISVAQEHVFSSFLKEKIYSALSQLEQKKTLAKSKKESRFVLATPEGDHHETGLLLGHLLIRSYGFTSLYIGPHTPAQDLSETAIRFDATHVLIVSTVSKKNGADQELLSYVSDIQKKVGNHVHILIAGSEAPATQSSKPQFSVLKSFHALENLLENLNGSRRKITS